VKTPLRFLSSLWLSAFWPESVQAVSPSRIETESFTSAVLADNLIGLDTERTVMVNLPSGYDESEAYFRVIYYLHNFWWSNTQMFADGVVQATLDRAIDSGVMRPFILVAGDYATPRTGRVLREFSGVRADAGLHDRRDRAVD
jgi:enterochelin esterase-like enzyme